MKPEGSYFTFAQAASSISANIYIGDIDYTYNIFDFERKEYSNTFLKDLPNSDGSGPIFQKNIMNKDIQIEYVGCTDTSTRNVLPDDDQVNSILRRFTIKTYTIKGTNSAPSAVDALTTLQRDHARRYDVFQAYFKLFGLKLSYQYFYNLRNENFSYITNSGLSMVGPSISETNVLIRSFKNSPAYWSPATNLTIVKNWELSAEVYSIEEPQRIF